MVKPGPKAKPVMERVLARIQIDDNGCWLWLGALDRNGYGKVSVLGKGMCFVHRVTYMAAFGETDLPLDHLCRVRACCNPTHLEPVTQEENVRRGDHCYRDDGRTRTCPQGHDVTGLKECRTCESARRREKYRALRATGLSGREAARRS